MQLFKPVSSAVISAVQFIGPEAIGRMQAKPALPTGASWNSFAASLQVFPVVQTIRGEVQLVPTDWIITDVDGNYFVMSDATFKKSYESATVAS